MILGKTISPARSTAIAAGGVVAALALSLIAPWSLVRFAPYAFHAYSPGFWWALGAAWLIFWLLTATWAIKQRKYVTRRAWAEQGIGDEPERPNTRRSTAVILTIGAPLMTLIIASLPALGEHGLRSGVAQHPDNWLLENRLDAYRAFESDPKQYPWEPRPAVWVDEFYCAEELMRHGINLSFIAALKSAGEEPHENIILYAEMLEEQFAENVNLLSDPRYATAHEQLFNAASDVTTADTSLPEVVTATLEICGTEHLSGQDIARLDRAAAFEFQKLLS